MRLFWKIALPIFLSIILVGGIFIFKTRFQQSSISQKEKSLEGDLCSTLPEEAKTLCEECKRTTQGVFLLKCTAREVIHFDSQLAKEICLKIPEKDEQKLCFAEALRRVDLNASLQQCDLIEDIGKKAFCRALTFRDMNEIQKGRKECETFLSLNNTDAYYQCLAFLLKDRSYCEKINKEELKKSCQTSL
jgi:hypothetical protein